MAGAALRFISHSPVHRQASSTGKCLVRGIGGVEGYLPQVAPPPPSAPCRLPASGPLPPPPTRPSAFRFPTQPFPPSVAHTLAAPVQLRFPPDRSPALLHRHRARCDCGRLRRRAWMRVQVLRSLGEWLACAAIASPAHCADACASRRTTLRRTFTPSARARCAPSVVPDLRCIHPPQPYIIFVNSPIIIFRQARVVGVRVDRPYERPLRDLPSGQRVRSPVQCHAAMIELRRACPSGPPGARGRRPRR